MADRPNIVFMLADNIGWGDLSCYGNLNPIESGSVVGCR